MPGDSPTPSRSHGAGSRPGQTRATGLLARSAGFPALDDYGLIGNLRTAALVSRHGSIDWACLPEFDSPSTFARILDLQRGGFFEIAPTETYRSHQAYLPSTAILRTTFSLSGFRSLQLIDFFPVVRSPKGAHAPRIVRVVEATGGPVEVETTLAPRLGYGRWRPVWRRRGEGWVGSSRAGTVAVRPGFSVEDDRGGGLRGRGTLEDGARAVFELTWGEGGPSGVPPLELLRQTERFWSDWVHPPESLIHLLAGRWHLWIERSEITLKLLSRADSGAFIAAPTTSLPEWPGGERNWDYRYVWIRDSAFAAQSLALMGHVLEAREFLHWVLGILRRRGRAEPLRVMYGVRGEPGPPERELSYLSGYRNSRPVRIGNAAARQFQLDIYGELLDAARLLAEADRDAIGPSWHRLSALADQVARQWRRPDRGIWELRSPPAHYVYSKVMAWVALDRAIELGQQFGTRAPTVRWERERDRIRAAVLERGFNRRRGTFVQAFDHPTIDAANLRIPLVGFLAPDDPRIAGTVLAIERELCHGPFVRRFRPGVRTGEPEAAFLPCSFWLVDCLARAGERERAHANFDALIDVASPLGLFSEEYEPRGGVALGNYPQAFTHIALMRAALALGISEVPASALEEHPALAWIARRRPSGEVEPIPAGEHARRVPGARAATRAAAGRRPSPKHRIE